MFLKRRPRSRSYFLHYCMVALALASTCFWSLDVDGKLRLRVALTHPCPRLYLAACPSTLPKKSRQPHPGGAQDGGKDGIEKSG